MPVIAIVNRKGGSGKSTLAAHIAAWCAHNGSAVMLGDVDRQQSARSWLKRRAPGLPAIAPWAVDQKNMLRVPSGITHVVLDTPGGLHGFELARVVMFADAIVMPVCHSMFDRDSAAQCHAELMAMPRIASGRCRLATVGMRIDGRTSAAASLRTWSEGLGLPFLGALRETQLYVRSLERGLTIFDIPQRTAATDLAQWEPILDWLRPAFFAPLAANDSQPASSRTAPVEPLAPASRVLASARQPVLPTPRPSVLPPSRLGSSLPGSLMPAQESLIHGARMSAHSSAPSPGQPAKVAETFQATRQLNRPDGEQIPSFLHRQG